MKKGTQQSSRLDWAQKTVRKSKVLVIETFPWQCLRGRNTVKLISCGTGPGVAHPASANADVADVLYKCTLLTKGTLLAAAAWPL